MDKGDTESLIRDFATRIRSGDILPVAHLPFGVVQHMRPPPPEESLDEKYATKEKALKRKLANERKAARDELANEIRESRKILQHLKWKRDHAYAIAQDEVTKKGRAKRAEMAKKLVSARKRLAALQATITDLTASIANAKMIRANGIYPDIPAPFLVPHKEGHGLPECPGIYFIWRGDVIIYVGQSIKLSGRARLGTHHVLKASHRLSYLCIDPRELTWAECYYIGLTRATENFGQAASHRSHNAKVKDKPSLENAGAAESRNTQDDGEAGEIPAPDEGRSDRTELLAGI